MFHYNAQIGAIAFAKKGVTIMNARCSRFLLGCFFLMAVGAMSAGAQAPDPKVPQIPVARPVVRMVENFEVFSGRTEPVSRVELRCRVSGYLVKTNFLEGSEVKKGDLLFEIDPRPFQVEMEKADAAVVLAEVRLKLADANATRAAALKGTGAISLEEFNRTLAEHAEALASLRFAKAGREAARLNIDYTRVLAPIDGRIGQRLVDPGNLIKADDTRLAMLISRDPMYVVFDVDERTLLRWRQSMKGEGKVAKVKVDIALAEDAGFPRAGQVDFVDNQVDPATGRLRVRAVMDNPDGLLMPGMKAHVRLRIGLPYNALLIPAQSILVEDGKQYVLAVNDDNVLAMRTVTVGKQHDGLKVVESGLKAEDRVVIGALGKLRPGMKVQPKLEAMP